MFKIAEKALNKNPQLQKVVIINRIERYDTEESDPYRVKSQLSKLGNTEYERLWNESTYKDKIIVSKTNLNITGSTIEKRFGSMEDQYFDGIHTTSGHGKTVLTQNLLNILHDSTILKHKFDYKAAQNIQTPYQTYNRNRDHQKYFKNNQNQFTRVQNNKNWKQFTNNENQNMSSQSPANTTTNTPPQHKIRYPLTDSRGFTIPTNNRFSELSNSESWSDHVDNEQRYDPGNNTLGNW